MPPIDLNAIFLLLLILLQLLVLIVGFIWMRRLHLQRASDSPAMMRLEALVREESRHNREEIASQARRDRHELGESLQLALERFQQGQLQQTQATHELLRQLFSQLEQRQQQLLHRTEAKLDEVRATVDEKLSQTLNERLGQSFNTVGKQLQAVQEGLGEMRHLAQDVGGLKKVLSHVKNRGTLGEIRLEMLLEQMLAPSQFESNVITKRGTRDMVEFAVKLPGKGPAGETLYLPIDAKFPQDRYEQLLDAQESANSAQLQLATRNFESAIKSMAKDIRDKYIDPPHTTDFALLFLPFEGIYAEVVRRAHLFEELQRDYQVIVTGPSTLSAILHSLQVGFRTLAMEQRSSEVWGVLGEVKKEFVKFGTLLTKAKDHFQTGMSQLDDVVGTRSRAIERRLRDIELPETPLPETQLSTRESTIDDTL